MSEVDENPTRQVIPSPQDRCRRCEHPSELHTPEVGCQVELSPTSVPSFDMGGLCSCEAFVYEPASEPAPPPEPELLDGPTMYAEALGYVRLARTASSPLVEDAALAKAATYFAGASAAALAEIVIENGTGDLTERRWLAALAGQDELPAELPPTTITRIPGGNA